MRIKFGCDIRELTAIRADSGGLGREALQGRGKESQTCTAFRSWLKINQFRSNQCNLPSKNLQLSCVSLTTKTLTAFCLVTLLVTLQDQSSLKLVKILTGVCMLNNVCSILNRPFSRYLRFLHAL